VATSLVERVPMTVLAALMILAGISAIDVGEARSIWNTGHSARWPILTTFLATLVFSVPVAVGIGVLLAFFIFLVSSASDITVRALVRQENGEIREGPVPDRLPSNDVTVLNVYGSLFFAGARTLGDLLPDPDGAARPVVVLRLRGRTQVGSTLIEELDHYADELAESGGRLYLSGLEEELAQQLRRTGKLDLEQSVGLVPVSDVMGASTRQAVADARAWLSRGTQPE
jgi:SulP family sulfate permease